MRPTLLEDFFGHERHLGTGQPLRTWIEADRIPSILLWGPPGCGKTTLAKLIANRTQSRFESMSAVTASVKDIREAAETARFQKEVQGRRTLLFVDEIHRFNRAQQDALLPYVEEGLLTLVGATTENPSFEMNAALLSRMRVMRMDPLEVSALKQILLRALSEPKVGLDNKLRISDEVIDWLAQTSEGDARRALTALENLWMTSAALGIHETVELPKAQELLKTSQLRQPIPHDKGGESHYNVISAFIKSIRDSDPDAGLYYLARLLEGGEDPLFIARRLVILASEDVGNADPRAIQVAIAVKDAVDFLGMPEARISLAQAVTYIAVAPKSNAAYIGIGEALEEVQETGALQVPMHLRNAPTRLMKDEGYGKGYRYSHDLPESTVRQSNLPEAIKTKVFYRPKEIGLEKAIAEKLRAQSRRSTPLDT